MALRDLGPSNDLEISILAARRGSKSLGDLLLQLSRSDLFISSKKDVNEDGTGFEPLLFEESCNKLVAVFSALERPSLHSNTASFVLKMRGREFFLRMPSQYGVIVNPGYTGQLIISPDAVLNLKGRLMAI